MWDLHVVWFVGLNHEFVLSFLFYHILGFSAITSLTGNSSTDPLFQELLNFPSHEGLYNKSHK